MTSNDDDDPPEEAAYARGTDPGTSHIAAARVDTKKLVPIIHAALLDGGDMTTQQISDRTEIEYRSVTPRMKPMEEAGLVIRVGRSLDRKPRIIWRGIPRQLSLEDLFR